MEILLCYLESVLGRNCVASDPIRSSTDPQHDIVYPH